MNVVCESGVSFRLNSHEHVIISLSQKPGEAFDVRTEWESDRAWMFAKPGKLIVWAGKVEQIKSVG